MVGFFFSKKQNELLQMDGFITEMTMLIIDDVVLQGEIKVITSRVKAKLLGSFCLKL